MKIKFNLKERKKEIIVLCVYSALLGILMFLINNLNTLQETRKFEEDLARVQYNNIKNSNVSEEELMESLKELTLEVENLKQSVPVNLSYREVNEMLAEIIKDNGNIFNLGNCNVTEIKSAEGYNAYEVRISSINGEYYQVKNLMNYIEQYKVKIKIEQMDLNKTNTNVQGNLILVFYGTRGNEVNV